MNRNEQQSISKISFLTGFLLALISSLFAQPELPGRDDPRTNDFHSATYGLIRLPVKAFENIEAEIIPHANLKSWVRSYQAANYLLYQAAIRSVDDPEPPCPPEPCLQTALSGPECHCLPPWTYPIAKRNYHRQMADTGIFRPFIFLKMRNIKTTILCLDREGTVLAEVKPRNFKRILNLKGIRHWRKMPETNPNVGNRAQLKAFALYQANWIPCAGESGIPHSIVVIQKAKATTLNTFVYYFQPLSGVR